MNSFTSHNRSGLNAHIFRPPESPASLASTAPTDYFSPHRTKKRQRPDSSHGLSGSQHICTPSHQSSYGRSAETPSWIQCPTPSDAMYGSAGAQSSALVNERYALKGGLDTPGLMAAAAEDGGRYPGESDFRRQVGSMGERQGGGGAALTGPLARERNGVARMASSPNGYTSQAGGWTSMAFGLVGKMFSFGTTVIKGFYAGSGRGYDLDGQQQQASPPYASMRAQRYAGGGTPVPGQWHDDGDFLGDFEQDNPTYSPSSTTRPPNKRRQTDRDTWIMVGTPDENDTDTTPKRKASSTNIPRPSLPPRPTLASRASSRRSLAPVSRRSSSYITQTGSPALALTTNDTPKRRASVAPTRSPHGRPSSAGGRSLPGEGARRGSLRTPNGLIPDVEKIVKRQAKQEKAADRTMSNMNRQLKDLIQQAQAALGTKFDVQGDGGEDEAMTDERFVDEEW